MKNIYIVSLNVILISTLMLKPSSADSGTLKTVGKVSICATSIAAGTVVGTPIAMVRKAGSQYVDCVKEFKKDSNAFKFWGAGCSVPVAVVSGLIKGPVYSAKNAIRYSTDKPFGKDAFSLGKLEDNASATTKTNIRTDMDKPESQPWGTPR